MQRSLRIGTAAALLALASNAQAGGLQPPIIQPDLPVVGGVASEISRSFAAGSAGSAAAAPAARTATAAAPDFAESCGVVDPVISALRDQGFTSFTVDVGSSQARIGARRGTVLNEFVYDCQTAQVLAKRGARVPADHQPGVSYAQSVDGRDFAAPAAAAASLAAASEGASDAEADLASPAGGATVALDAGNTQTGQASVVTDRAPGASATATGGSVQSAATTKARGTAPAVSAEAEVSGRAVAQADTGVRWGHDKERGGCGSVDDDENRPDRQDNCGHGNNRDGIDEDNPGLANGGGPVAKAGDGKGPGNGGLGGQGKSKGRG